MNPEEFVSKDDLLAAGWTALKIDAALDEADEVGPTGHWLNTAGKPYYHRDRVAVAAYRIGLKSEMPLSAQWTTWAQKAKPTALPLATFNFHRLADVVLSSENERFFSLRLSHPVLGRRVGTKDEERLLIEEVLKKLVMKVSGLQLESQKALLHFFSEKSVLAARGSEIQRPDEIVVRPARRLSYVSKAVSDKSIQRFIDVISLVHAGLVKDHDGQQIELIELLLHSPQFRLDIKCGEQPTFLPTGSSPSSNHHLLRQGELCDMPGRNESWCDYVRYGGDNRWELHTDGTDLTGLSQLEPVTEVMGTTALIEWALRRDQELEDGPDEDMENLEDPESDGDRRCLGPVASRLYEIATELSETFCVARMDAWLAGGWPASSKKPAVRILNIKGVTTRAVWIRIYHAVFDVETNLGPAYLYPPDAEGCARLILKSKNSESAVHSVQVPKSMLPRIKVLMPTLELSRSQKKQPEPKLNKGKAS